MGGATAREQIALARRATASSLDVAHRTYRRRIQGHTGTLMVPSTLEVDGHQMRYAVSSNDEGADQLWAVNIHGFLCGGEMYDRESERLAEAMGWRVINPSLPGFGGSDPLAWKEISMAALARRVLLGHSMGGGVAVEFASAQPERVLGIIYRDGIATPSWHQRHGMIPTVFETVAPDVGPLADLALALLLDIPDLFVGRMLSTLRSVLPDVRRNIKTLAWTAPVGSMLMEVDLTKEVVALRDSGIPVLAEWGCFDRISNPETAAEFSDIAGVPLQWIPGGHSWMLARPSGQAEVLRFVPLGRQFIEDVERRHRGGTEVPRLRAV